MLVLEAWRDALAASGAGEDELNKVEEMMPKRLKKKRQIYGEDAEPAGWVQHKFGGRVLDTCEVPMRLGLFFMSFGRTNATI